MNRGLRGGIVVAVVAFVVIAVASIALDRSPARPAGLTGKFIYHGTKRVSDGSTITVVLGERSYNPTFVKGPAGARFVVHLQAEGFHAHTFTVPALGIDVTVPPGAVANVPITIPAGPTTVFYCRFHQSQGMQGAILERGP